MAIGKIQRCPILGRAPGNQDGAYLLYLDGLAAGGFQNHADPEGWQNWHADLGRPLTSQEAATYQERVEAAQKIREAEENRARAAAAANAANAWEESTPCEFHPYLKKKGVKSHGLRVIGDKLVMPFYSPSGAISTYQTITATGTKRWLTDGRKKGCFYIIGKPAGGPIAIAEGFATAASIHEATGYPVAVAGDAGNLVPVARALRLIHPQAELVICADDDYRTAGNPGLTAAQEAAKATGGRVALPVWAAERPEGRKDFNDLAQTDGHEAVKKCIVPEARPALIDLLLTGPELARMKIPAREMIVAPFIATGSLNLVVAPRGLGKTFFGMELCKSVTTGAPFFEWQVPVARNVLFLDGEMPTEMLQERFAFLYQGNVSDRLFILPSEALWTKDKPLNLNEPESQQRVQTLLNDLEAQGNKPPLIIMDNLSSLSFGVDENDNTMQDSILRWLMGLRHQGYSVLLVHHTGKSGEQRGASRREDFLDTSIKLSKPDGGGQGEGAAFKIEFTKERGRKASPNTLTVALEEGPHGEPIWTKPKTMPEYMRALLTIYQHHPDNYTALGKLLDISRQAAQKHVEKLREKGFIHPLKMALTTKGNRAIPELNQMEAA